MIRKNGLQKQIFLLGFIPHASTYLRALDIFVLPSVKEGLPYVLLEAESAGIPVIATSVGGIPDIIQHGINGLLVAPKNPEVLARAIHQLIQSKDMRRFFATEATKKSRVFSLEKMLGETIMLYQKLSVGL